MTDNLQELKQVMTRDLDKLKPAYVLSSDLVEMPPTIPQRPRSIDPVSAISPVAGKIRTISSSIDVVTAEDVKGWKENIGAVLG